MYQAQSRTFLLRGRPKAMVVGRRKDHTYNANKIVKEASDAFRNISHRTIIGKVI